MKIRSIKSMISKNGSWNPQHVLSKPSTEQNLFSSEERIRVVGKNVAREVGGEECGTREGGDRLECGDPVG